MKPRIYLPIEIKNRELVSRIYFAIYASKLGWSVVIGRKNKFINFIKKLRPGNYISKSVGDFKKIDKYLTKNNFVKSFIDEEGLMSFNETFTHRRTSKEILGKLQNYFVWGKNHFDEIKKLHPEFVDKIKIVGNSRIDIVKDNQVMLFKKEVEQIKKIYGDYFLLATKFGKVNYIKRKNVISWYDSQLKKGLLFDENQKKICKKSILHEKENFENFINFLGDFEKKRLKTKLLIKVHPSENPKIWEEIIKIKGYKNIYVCNDKFYTNSYILGSRSLIQNNCTTSIEALFLNVPSLQLNVFKDKDVEYDLPKKISKEYNSNKELIDYLLEIDNKKNISPDKEKINLFSNYIENYGGKFSFEMLINYLDKNIYHKNENFNFKFEKIKYSLKSYVYLIKNYLFDRGMIEVSNHKFRDLELGEIRKISYLLTNKDNLEKISIDELLPGLFIFERSN